MPYVALQQMLDEANAWGFYNYDKGCYVEDLSDDVIDVFTEHARARRHRCRSCCSTGSTAATAPSVRTRRRSAAVARRGSTCSRSRCARRLSCSTPTAHGCATSWPSWSRTRSTASTSTRSTIDEIEDRVRAAYGAGEVRAAGRDQAQVRPGQRLPPQRQHQAGRSGAGAARRRPHREREGVIRTALIAATAATATIAHQACRKPS